MIDRIKHIFVEETNSDLQSLKEDLKDISLELDDQMLEKVFRTMHTIKGSAPMFGFNHLTEIALPVEMVFKGLCDGRIEINNQIIDKTKDVVSLIQEVLNKKDDHLPTLEEEKQMLIHYFMNIDRLNAQAYD